MSRKPNPVPIEAHVDDDKAQARTDLATFRQAENKPDVVKPPTEGKAN
jgi:hypothetical protein